MSLTHMEPLAFWGHNSHTKPKDHGTITQITDYVVYAVPRSMFRQAASMFSDIRHADSNARYDEITMQLFLQMIYMSVSLEGAMIPTDAFPYIQAWLEWVPSSTRPDDAVSYRLHAVSLSASVRFGTALSSMLHESSQLHKESSNRKMNSRKTDPLSGLHPYQKWMRVSGMEMYIRTICDRYSASQEFTSKMDDILKPTAKLDDAGPNGNPANPTNVFTIDRALQRTPAESADKRFLSREAYTGSNVVGEDVTTLTFPSAEHVILLTPSQLNPKTFCGKYLPEHQRWMKIQQTIPPKILGDEYDQNCQTEYCIDTPADIERARLDGMSDRSAFESLSHQTKAKYVTDCLPYENTPSYPNKYREFQEWGVEAMEKQCLDPDACISEVVSKMLTWRETHQDAAIIKQRISDTSLSVFANRVVRLMEDYEQYYLISTAHRMMFLIHHARYDAFRRDFGLHFNCFQAGESACSKSFLFTVMEKESIPGTTEVLTYQTGKADAVDGNRNDITTVCHEAPPGMFRTAKNPNADSTQEAMFKEKLTSQRVTAKIWCQDEGTGRRSARLCKSECIGVWMGATNDPPSEVEEALKTRFFWGNFEQQQRHGRDIDDCMNGERMMSPADKRHRRQLFAEAQEEQFRVMLVEKGIWTGVIRDVNISAYNIVMPRLKSKMTKNSIVRPGPRDWERVKIFSRSMAIVTAIERVCNLPGGEHYGEPFNVHMLPSLEPHLCVTEEMVIFTLSLLSDQFRSPVEHKILNTIWNMEKNAPKFGSPTEEETSSNYIKLPKLYQLAKNINTRMPLSNGRTSQNNIQNFISNMTKHSVMAHKYKPPTPPIGTTVRANPFPVVDSKSRQQQYQSCVITDSVYIHVSHLLAHTEASADNIFHILSSETHAHSSNKRMLTAIPVSNQLFHVFKVIDRTAGGSALKYKNILANSDCSRLITGTADSEAMTRTRGGYTIDQDIDEHVAQKLSSTIGKTALTPLQVVERLVRAEKQLVEDMELVNQTTILYPTTLVQSIATLATSITTLARSIDTLAANVTTNKRNREDNDEMDNKKMKSI